MCTESVNYAFLKVMGEGNKRVVTLSHRAQVRRFTSDLLRVLKSKASKQIALSEFPSVYNRVIGTVDDGFSLTKIKFLITLIKSERSFV